MVRKEKKILGYKVWKERNNERKERKGVRKVRK